MGNRKSNNSSGTSRRAKKAKNAEKAGKDPARGAGRRPGKSAKRNTTRKKTVNNSGILRTGRASR